MTSEQVLFANNPHLPVMVACEASPMEIAAYDYDLEKPITTIVSISVSRAY